ncbi:hypothetical protein LCGC14_1089480 [marine sediment metagenome]|uniref:Uncharacterized protein n=1 Tax=marine sediment metagenome TaxID=412755 RepID=A0A0F9PVX7_9ZZZZ
MATKTEQLPPIAVNIPKPNIQTIEIVLVGDARLVLHKWSEKAIGEMEDKRAGKARKKKEPVNPQEQYEAAMYSLPDGSQGFPAGGVKKSAVNACRYTEGITMVMARGVIFVERDVVDDDGNDLVLIHGDGPYMRRDMVRIAMGTTDIRYRPEFRTWKIKVRVRFNANIITAEQLINLFNLAGHHVGIGEGRPGAPKNTMDWGLFHIATGEELEEAA